MKTFFNLAVVFAILAASGCVSVKTIRVDAIASPESVESKTCAVVPANPQISPDDLRFREMTGVIERAFATRGYTFVDDSSKADVILAIDASLGAPENVAVASVDHMYDPDFCGVGRVPVRGRNGRMCFVRASVWYPSPGPYYADETVYRETFYEKRLIVTAYRNTGEKAEELQQIWSVAVVAHDSSSDIRSYMPSLALAAARHAGNDTKGQIVVGISADDPELLKIAPPVPADESAGKKGSGKSDKFLIDEK
jgi:hypothetical protein